jgi:voltage-gated sodium channel
MIALCRKIADSEDFHRFILFLILLSALTMGFGAVPDLAEMYDDHLFVIDTVVQVVFVIEILIRLLAQAPRVGGFFRDRWNVFDFTVVALSLVPAVGSFALIARLLRVLRVLRVFSVSAPLRRFLARLQEALDELFSAAVIALVVGYMFVIAGHYLFADIDPARWGGLREAVLSVFYLALFQDVKSFVAPLVDRTMFALFYFVLFYAATVGLAISVVVAAVLQGQERKK